MKSVIVSLRLNPKVAKRVRYLSRINGFKLRETVEQVVEQMYCDPKFLNDEISKTQEKLDFLNRLKDKAKDDNQKVVAKMIVFDDKIKDPSYQNYWLNAIKMIKRDPNFLKGQYNLYKNSFDFNITEREYLSMLEKAIEMFSPEVIGVKV